MVKAEAGQGIPWETSIEGLRASDALARIEEKELLDFCEAVRPMDDEPVALRPKTSSSRGMTASPREAEGLA